MKEITVKNSGFIFIVQTRLIDRRPRHFVSVEMVNKAKRGDFHVDSGFEMKKQAVSLSFRTTCYLMDRIYFSVDEKRRRKKVCRIDTISETHSVGQDGLRANQATKHTRKFLVREFDLEDNSIPNFLREYRSNEIL